MDAPAQPVHTGVFPRAAEVRHQGTIFVHLDFVLAGGVMTLPDASCSLCAMTARNTATALAVLEAVRATFVLILRIRFSGLHPEG